MIQIKLWIGEEKEGINKRSVTLFVGSNKLTTVDIMSTAISQEDDIDQIYFGAGGCTDINFKVVREVIKENDKDLCAFITLEVNLDKLDKVPKDILLHTDIEWIVTMNHKNFNLVKQIEETCTQIKLQSVKTKKKCLYITRMSNFDEVDLTKLKGKRYIGDKILK